MLTSACLRASGASPRHSAMISSLLKHFGQARRSTFGALKHFCNHGFESTGRQTGQMHQGL